MKTAILFRLGGLGDLIILGCVGEELKRRGYEVDACVGSPTCDAQNLFAHTNIFRTVFKQDKVFTGLDVYTDEEENKLSVEFLKKDYDLVVDYKNSIELNSHYKHMVNGPGKEWFVSQNSNYMNWMDMMFAWANIDPKEVLPEHKIPIFVSNDEEKAWAEKVIGKRDGALVFAIQTNASSLVRTWYHPDRLPEALRNEFPDKKLRILVFDGGMWHMLRGKSSFPIQIPTNFDPIRASAALVGASSIFIGADSGFSHVAEALGVKSVTIYTTVPAWTRMGYYKHAKAVEPIGKTFDGVECRPCFILDRYCPRIRERAAKELTPRELKIKESAEKNLPPHIVAKELNTTPQGIMMEAEMMSKRFQALLEVQAPCSETITPERIIEKVKELL